MKGEKNECEGWGYINNYIRSTTYHCTVNHGIGIDKSVRTILSVADRNIAKDAG